MAKTHKAAKPMIWVQTQNGDTFLCPTDKVKDPKSVTKSELKFCVNESYNPQNN